MARSTKPPEFHATQRLQREYEAGMRQIIKRVLPPKMPEQTFEQWRAEVARRSQEPDILNASNWLARRMVHWVNIKNAKTWREAASRSMQNRRLYALLEREMQGATGARVSQLVRENAELIRAIPLKAAETLNGEILRAQQRGARPGTIAKMTANRFPELLRSRVNLISRTETQKASTALTRARSEDVGADWYIWESSKDQRTRKSHKNMHGVVCGFHDNPSPEALVGEPAGLGAYGPGECPNCRCGPIVVLTLDDIKFPARVYWQGSIRRMTKQDFKQIAVGLESRAA